MEKIPCSVGVLTFNSGTTLRRALESVHEFDDIIVNDGGSTDDTLVIAKEFGCHIISQDKQYQNAEGRLNDYAGVRNQCLAAAKHDWFLYVDSDERAAPELVEEIRGIVAQRDPATLIYNISPRIVVEGMVVEHSSNYPGWQKRFFNKKTGAYFRKPLHERITYDESRYIPGYLQGHWQYFVPLNYEVAKSWRYARIDALIHQTRNTSLFLKFAIPRLVIAAKVALKTLYNYARYGSKGNMPLILEYSRIEYQFMLFWLLLKAYFGKKI